QAGGDRAVEPEIEGERHAQAVVSPRMPVHTERTRERALSFRRGQPVTEHLSFRPIVRYRRVVGGRAGLCILCGAEMRLAKVDPDETMIVAGFEYHSFECTGCGEVERRLTFTRHSEPSTRHTEPAAEPVPH